MDQTQASLEAQHQLYSDIKTIFGTEAGKRFLAWWRRQARHGHAVLVEGDSHATHFYLGRQADINAVVEILNTDLADLLAHLRDLAGQREFDAGGTDPMWAAGTRGDDWLYPKEGHHKEGHHGEE